MGKKYIIDGMEFDEDSIMVMFSDVFDWIGSFVLKKSDEELKWDVYDDYEPAHMADFRLDILVDSGYITKDIKLKAQKIRQLSEIMLAENKERSADVVRNSSEWHQIFSMADEVRAFLKK